MLENVYRVLLTRGRDGLIIVVPNDQTFDATELTLLASGVRPLPGSESAMATTAAEDRPASNDHRRMPVRSLPQYRLTQRGPTRCRGARMSQFTLFDATDGQPEELLPYAGSALLHRTALNPQAAQGVFAELLEAVPWEQRSVQMFGKPVPQPRLVAWFGDGAAYTYSGLRLEPHPWLPLLMELRQICEELAGTSFNSGLANLYRDGQDTVAWHADDEPELGDNPTIASMSLGAIRRFDLRHRETGETIRTELPSGSVLVMSGASQSAWLHQVPRTAKVSEPRINLTFRSVGEHV